MMTKIENPVLVSVKFKYLMGYEEEFVIREASISEDDFNEFFYYDEDEEGEVLDEEEFREALYELFNMDKKRYEVTKFVWNYFTNIEDLY